MLSASLNKTFPSFFPSLIGLVWSRDDGMNGTPTSQCHFGYGVGYGITMTDRTPLHIVQGRVTEQYYRVNILTRFVVPFARRVGRRLGFQEREREMFYLTTHSTHFINGYMASDMVKDHSDSEKGNPLLPHRLLLSINSKGSFICTIPQTG